jgi:HlyD family type I secretion membrane fusion protein
MKQLVKYDLKRLTQWAAPDVPAEPPVIGGPIDAPLSDMARQNLRKPIVLGLAVIGVFVIGLGAWAAASQIRGAVAAPGVFRVEASRKTLKSRDGGLVRQINVHEGDAVQAGQLLLKFDDTVPKAQVDIYENQYDAALMQAARLRAEIVRRPLIVPPELQARRADPRVSAIIQNEQTVYDVRKTAIEAQAAILNQRFEQLQSARTGLQIQADSAVEQIALSEEELQGYKTLLAKGFAPKTLVLRLERQLSDSKAKRGALMAEITRNSQQAGETRLQLSSLYEQRASESASNLRDVEARITDLGPRLGAAREGLAQTEIRAPAAGYVLGLSQHTIGGVAAPGEILMDVVPSNAPLVITAEVRPSDIDEVRPGMQAQVMLQAYNSYRVPKIEAEVLNVSADSLANPETKSSYYRVDLRITPEELRKLPKGVRLYPGMQVSVMIMTGKRTILSFLLGPIGQVLDHSMREQ